MPQPESMKFATKVKTHIFHPPFHQISSFLHCSNIFSHLIIHLSHIYYLFFHLFSLISNFLRTFTTLPKSRAGLRSRFSILELKFKFYQFFLVLIITFCPIFSCITGDSQFLLESKKKLLESPFNNPKR